MTKILLTGKNGQLGWELQRSLSTMGEIYALDSNECNLADLVKLRQVIAHHRPDVIVNAAAYTAVDRAESDSQLAYAVNATAPGLMAEEAARLGAWLIHYSTDYVFDGAKAGWYGEEDVPHPLSVYGASKLAGEQAVSDSNCKALIFRTSWVFSARGANFAKTMLRLARERSELKVVGDQYGAPTSAELIADVTALVLQRLLKGNADELVGIYNLVAAGEASWYEYANFVISSAYEHGVQLKCLPDSIFSIPTNEYPLPAKRPLNSRLDTSKLKRAFAVNLPPWQYHVSRMLDEVLGKQYPS